MATIIQFRPRPVPAPAQATDAAACIGNTVILFPGAERAPAPVPAPAPAKPAKRKRGNTQEDDQRKAMLGKVHIAKKDLMRLPGFDDTVYRDILEHQFSASSAAELSNKQLHGLLAYFASLGWQAKKGRNRRLAPAALTHDATGMHREEQIGKIEAMLAEKGRVEGTDVPWGYAVSILKRQSNGEVKSFQDEKATPKLLDAVIAALYRDAKRKGRRVR